MLHCRVKQTCQKDGNIRSMHKNSANNSLHCNVFKEANMNLSYVYRTRVNQWIATSSAILIQIGRQRRTLNPYKSSCYVSPTKGNKAYRNIIKHYLEQLY